MLLDMTEHDQAERALRRSEDYLRSIVNTAVDAIITINQHGTIETFNLAAEQMFGYTAAEVVGQNVRLLMPQPYRDEHDGYLARYLKTGEARIIGIGREVVGLRKDGTTFPLDLAISQIDHLRRFTGILRDLSDRRKLEWRLAESQAEERRHVARELHDGMGGHMTGIGLLAQTLQTHLAKASSPLAAKAEDLVRSIDEAQKQLRSIVRELMPVEATPDGLMAALQELATQAETQYDLRCHFRCERPVYLDDPAAAKHVFRIVQEAAQQRRAARQADAHHHQPRADRTASGSRRERRRQRAEGDAGRTSGHRPGKHVATRAPVGRRPLRSAARRRRDGRDVLGAVAAQRRRTRRAVQASHGQGLMARCSSAAHEAAKKPGAEPVRCRIVIVDDHPIVRKGLTELINGEPDMTVCGESDTAAGGLERIRVDRPDVAIVDLSLGMDSGLQLVKQLDASLPDVRVLILSMHEETLHAERALAAGRAAATS